MARAKIRDFELANRIYASATATFYVANADGSKSATLATLYSGLTGSAQLANPQRFDSNGKLKQATYFEHANGVIATLAGLSIPTHDTGVMPAIPAWFDGSKSYNPGSLADGAGETTTVTVSGAALGDYVQVSFNLDLQSVALMAWVSATDTVSARFQNETGGVVDLASGTLRVRVTKA